MNPVRTHKAEARGRVVRCAVVTLSDTRTPATDTSGDAIVDRLPAAGATLAARHLLADDPEPLTRLLHELIDAADIDAILTTGGTGFSPRDHAAEVVAAFLTRPMPGFGELFRRLSVEQVGTAALLSRCLAGAAGDTFLAALPGSRPAVTLAMDRLIIPELGHIVTQLRPTEGT